MSGRRKSASHAQVWYFCKGCEAEGESPYWTQGYGEPKMDKKDARTKRCTLHERYRCETCGKLHYLGDECPGKGV